ncbi:hypothetical protein Trydic_g5300 [Trypoxylus dichotomus]
MTRTIFSYTRDTAKLPIQLYLWYYVPSTVHKILIHGAEIITAAALGYCQKKPKKEDRKTTNIIDFTSQGNILISKSELKQYDQLSLEIFEKHKTADRRSATAACYNCQEIVPDWNTTCPSCCVRYPICVVSGQSIIDDGLPVWICPDCHHYALKSHMTYRNKICPLCHISSSTSLYED